jgi:hypothetical protein
MKTLSLWQPWLFAVLYLGKRLENRSRKDGKMPMVCHHRGPLLLHASKGFGGLENFQSAVGTIANVAGPASIGKMETAGWITVDRAGFSYLVPTPSRCRPGPKLPLGGIVGRCNVVGTMHPDGMQRGRGDRVADPGDMRWHFPGSYALILADVEPLPFTPYKGAQGLFEVSL